METEKMEIEKNCSTPIKYLIKQPIQLYSPIKNIATTSTNSMESPFKCASYSTPPTKFFKVRNPFDAALANRLHLPISSPSVFKKMPTPVKTEFQWSIDELSSLKPVHIEEHISNQFDQPEDPEIERTAQQNIEKYFRESKQIVPSPWNEIPRKQIILPKDSTPMRAGLKNVVDVEKRDNACQTVLSLPPVLPPEIEKILRPFFTFTEDQQLCNNINENLMNASLCRRLFHFSSEDESIDSTNSSVKSGDLPPFQSPKMNESGKHHDKSFEHRKCMTLESPCLSPVQRISSSDSDELHASDHKEKTNNSINQKMSLIHQSTPTPSPQSYKNLLSEQETLEESPLSPITKPIHENSINNKIQSSSPLIEQPTMATATTSNTVSNTVANTSRRSIKRLDFSDDLMSVDYVVPDSENLPDQSINMMGTSILINDDEIDCTYSSVNWDIENKSISNTRQDKRIVFENDNVVKSIFNKFETTPSKRHYQRTLLKKYSDNFDERDKENVAPRSTLLRRCFSSDMTCDCGGRNDIRCRFHYFNKYRVNNSFASATTDDSDIRDRSLLDNERNTSPNSYLSENTQDTGYNSNVIGASSSATSLTNIFMANTNLVDGAGGRTISASSLDANNEWQSSTRIE